MSALVLVELSRSFAEHGMGAGVTAQLASVIRTAGIEKVIELGSSMLTNDDAGGVVVAHLTGAIDAGHDSDRVARELEAIADLQRFAELSFDDGVTS